jgi:hypothetical protein
MKSTIIEEISMSDIEKLQIDWFEGRNVREIVLAEKYELYQAIMNIEQSWTGRIDSDFQLGANAFLMESAQLLINAVKLFEQGYFDCAFYSIREAIELSTTIIYLSDMPSEEKRRHQEAWKNTLDFPMQGHMIKELSQKGEVFTELKNTFNSFLEEINSAQQSLNKYVHKQGFSHFYVSRNHFSNQKTSNDKLVKSFLFFFKKAVGTVAVMRLVIDPFPILLMDEEILYRCFDSLTEPYSEEFVEEYIGKTIMEAYKRSNFYRSTYDQFINYEKKNEPTFIVMKYQFIDTKKEKEISEQLHLLSFWDQCAITLAFEVKKITKVYFNDFISTYETDRKTNRKSHSWSSEDFKRFSSSESPINQSYDEVYISTFFIGEESIHIEHNEQISTEEIELLDQAIVKLNEIYKGLEGYN